VPRTLRKDPSANHPRVLLVESDPEHARNIIGLLGTGCDVAVAHTAAAAHQQLANDAWSGFIIDADLADGSGIALLAPIRAQHASAEMLLMCCCENVAASHEATAHHAYFITKPMSEPCAVAFREGILHGRRGSQAELITRLGTLGLTPREVAVIASLALGHTAPEVGAQLGISTRTVQGHCHAIYRRLDVNNLAELVAKANGWI
jgi:DNA-binding NarL/FixJ family response regulator